MLRHPLDRADRHARRLDKFGHLRRGRRGQPAVDGADEPHRRGFVALQHLAREIIADDQRSEEHTSELQSLMRISYAVFCLKKKNDRHYEKIQYSKSAEQSKKTLKYTKQ